MFEIIRCQNNLCELTELVTGGINIDGLLGRPGDRVSTLHWMLIQLANDKRIQEPYERISMPTFHTSGCPRIPAALLYTACPYIDTPKGTIELATT